MPPLGLLKVIWQTILRSGLSYRVIGLVAIFVILLIPLYRFLSISESTSIFVDRAIIVLIVFVLLATVSYQELNGRREAKYGSATANVRVMLKHMRDVCTLLGKEANNIRDLDTDKLDFIMNNNMERVIDQFASMFSTLTGSKCRASIKLVEYVGNSDLYVFTYIRDKDSKELNYKRDLARSEDRKDPIMENEDFNQIFKKDQEYFFSNDLCGKRSYANSSFKEYGTPKEHGAVGRIFPAYGWTLPYRATIVWPIQQTEIPGVGRDTALCVGFLTIDTPLPNRFNPTFDVPLGAGIADSLFHCFKMWSDIKASAPAREGSPNG